MSNNIEQLKTEVDDIKKSLGELKSNVDISETEKKTKAEALKAQAETTKQKIQKEINDLSNQSGQWEESKKEEAEALLNSFNEIMSLYDSITKTWNNAPIQQQTLPEVESKWIFWNIKEWIWNQWSDVKSWDKWKSEPLKNTLRTLWFWLTWYAAYKWIKALWKKIFWKKEEEEDEEEKEEKKSKKKKEEENDKEDGEKKSFRSKWYWKTIWWGAVWAWIYFLGKWLHLWWNKEDKTEKKTQEDKTEQKTQEQITTKQEKDEVKESQKEWNDIVESKETAKEWWDKISDEMFQQLLKMEGSQNHVAKTAKYFGETFTTWPYGQVYKHIDENGNLLKTPVPFKEWEKLTEERSKNNAKAFYDKKAKEWKKILDEKWCKYNQDMLDSLVCKSGWTAKATNNLKNFVLSHRNNKDEIFEYMSKHAITAAWNWKVMPGLVKRALFAANWFKWDKKPFSAYSYSKSKKAG